MPTRPPVHVTRIGAARSQLRTSIELWFQDSDPVSIHSLAFSAHQILNDLNRHAKGPKMMFDSPVIDDAKRADVVHALRAAANFFKHADSRKGKTRVKPKASDSIEFLPYLSEAYFVMCMAGLGHLGESLDSACSLFIAWCYFHRPDWVNDDWKRFIEDRIHVESRDHFRGLKKDRFFNEFQKALAMSGKIQPSH